MPAQHDHNKIHCRGAICKEILEKIITSIDESHHSAETDQPKLSAFTYLPAQARFQLRHKSVVTHRNNKTPSPHGPGVSHFSPRGRPARAA
jgi:hypothetical protein